jgi:hypothetical protein
MTDSAQSESPVPGQGREQGPRAGIWDAVGVLKKCATCVRTLFGELVQRCRRRFFSPPPSCHPWPLAAPALSVRLLVASSFLGNKTRAFCLLDGPRDGKCGGSARTF